MKVKWMKLRFFDYQKSLTSPTSIKAFQPNKISKSWHIVKFFNTNWVEKNNPKNEKFISKTALKIMIIFPFLCIMITSTRIYFLIVGWWIHEWLLFFNLSVIFFFEGFSRIFGINLACLTAVKIEIQFKLLGSFNLHFPWVLPDIQLQVLNKINLLLALTKHNWL